VWLACGWLGTLHMLWMWKPSSLVEEVEISHYAEEHMSLNGGMISTILQQPGFVGKVPRTFSRGGISGTPPYGSRVTPRTVATSILMVVSETSHSSPIA